MTAINTARRAFLRGRTDSSTPAHRVPWAVDNYLENCRRCDECIPACAEGILVRGDGGYPTVDFTRGGCTFCGRCAEACRYGAIERTPAAAWSLRAVINAGCLSARGITCHACADVCDLRAIRFRLELGGRAIPSVESTLCNGCGSCVASCPVQLIQLEEAV